MGKDPFSFRRRKKTVGRVLDVGNAGSAGEKVKEGLDGGGWVRKVKKKGGGARLWMRFDRWGRTEIVEWDKNAIVRHAGIPARDLRILGPLFSHSSNILAREKAMVVNLEFIKVIVTAEEVLLLDPLRQEVLPFIEKLRHQLPHKSQHKLHGPEDDQEIEMQVSTGTQWSHVQEPAEVLQSELPFEFQVLEIALEVICTYLDSSVADLERGAYPALDELARNVNTTNLELVRHLKSNLTLLLARVQKVRNEIEHLLDDNENMAQLHLTRKWLHSQQFEVDLRATTPNNLSNTTLIVPRPGSNINGRILTSSFGDHNDVEDLEMLLEAYFMMLDGIRNKILSVREYIDGTEDYVNIQLDNHRNELIQLQLTLSIASLAITVDTMIISVFEMNIHCPLYYRKGIFGIVAGGVVAAGGLVFLLLFAYAKWKRLIGS